MIAEGDRVCAGAATAAAQVVYRMHFLCCVGTWAVGWRWQTVLCVLGGSLALVRVSHKRIPLVTRYYLSSVIMVVQLVAVVI